MCDICNHCECGYSEELKCNKCGEELFVCSGKDTCDCIKDKLFICDGCVIDENINSLSYYENMCQDPYSSLNYHKNKMKQVFDELIDRC